MNRHLVSSIHRHGSAAFAAICVMFSVTTVQAEESGWQWSFAPYLWAAGIEGDVTAGTRSADIDVSFSDVFENLDMAFLGHLEAKQGPWAIAFSPIYLSLSADAERTGPGGGSREAELEMKTTIAELFAAYQVSEHWELMGGIRYLRQEVELEFTGPVLTGTSKTTDDVTDPIFGARYSARINDRWTFRGRGDIGGFAGNLESAWNASFLFGYQSAPENGTWIFGYRALDLEFDDGSTEMNMLMSGPIVGYVYTF